MAVFTQGLAHGGPDGFSPPHEHSVPRSQVTPRKHPSLEQGCLFSAEQTHFLPAFPIYRQPKVFYPASWPPATTA